MSLSRPVASLPLAASVLLPICAALATAACAPSTPAASPADVAATESTIRGLDAE